MMLNGKSEKSSMINDPCWMVAIPTQTSIKKNFWVVTHLNRP